MSDSPTTNSQDMAAQSPRQQVESDTAVPIADPTRRYVALKGEIDEAIARVFQSGRFILGTEVAALEREFADYLGCRHAVGVASGTDAVRLALIAGEIGPGDEVITVANAGDPTPMAIWSVGAIPRLVDVDASTYNMSVNQAEKLIGPRTKALLPVHLYGQAADLDPLVELARGAGLLLIEDACQAHGATYHGRRVGTIGDLGCFSFYPTKNLGAFGDGGIVVSNDERLAERVRLVREYGWMPRNRSLVKGVNSRLDELQAAVVRVQLRHLDRWNQRRREIAARYRKDITAALEDTSDFRSPTEASDREHVYHLFVGRSPHRDKLRRELLAHGVSSGIHYPTPAHLQPSFENYWTKRPSLLVTELLGEQVLSLPLFPELTEDEVSRVICAMRLSSR